MKYITETNTRHSENKARDVEHTFTTQWYRVTFVHGKAWQDTQTMTQAITLVQVPNITTVIILAVSVASTTNLILTMTLVILVALNSNFNPKPNPNLDPSHNLSHNTRSSPRVII